MDINTQELREQIIHPTLEYLDKSGVGAENVLVAIVTQKQHLSPQQLTGLGPFDISPAMHQLVWDRYLAFHPDLASRIRGLASQRAFLEDPHSELATNLCYATAIAWVVYILHPQEIEASVA
jgi:hypothetical protein